jgi:hypothetical protein
MASYGNLYSTLYSYDSLLECIYQGLIYGPMMSTVAYIVYIGFSHFPDVFYSIPAATASAEDWCWAIKHQKSK